MAFIAPVREGIMANPNIVEHGSKTRFTSERQPQNRGRRPNKLNQLKKYYRMSEDDLKEIIETSGGMTVATLRKILNDEKQPVELRQIVKVRLDEFNALKPANMYNLLAFWDRAYGKSMQNISQRIEQTDIPFDQLSQEERDRTVEDLIAKYKMPADQEPETTEDDKTE